MWIFQINPDKVHSDGKKYNIFDFKEAIARGTQDWGPHGGAYYKQVEIGDIVLFRNIHRRIKKNKTDKYKKWADKIVGVGKIKGIPTDIYGNFTIGIDKGISTKLIGNPLPCDSIKGHIPKIMMNKTIIPIIFPDNANYDILLGIIKKHLKIR